MNRPTPWRIEFEEDGGYDCMTAGYVIRDATGEEVVTVDCASYYDDESWRSDAREARHQECPEARAVAELIVQAVNAAVARREVGR